MGSVCADGEEAMPGPSGRTGQERILVSVRMRPLNKKEALRNEIVDWECINNTTIVYKNHMSPERSAYPTSYTFDRVFGCDCSTRQVYEEGAKAVVLSVVSGINSSVFAYGQTSSGKTFTMSGITEYTMEDIFDYIQKHKERVFQLKFSAMEIYNESVRDLLTADNSPLRLLDDRERGTVVEKLREETLQDRDHFKELLAVCQAQRQIGETLLNEASSRSHQILRLTIESSTRELLATNSSSPLAATLNFVDLAGSERSSQALSAGSRLKEGSHINRSLLTLGTVIRKLSKGGPGHIPYRDSKLTRILQSSLGGNARTAIICTMSPARRYVEQSRNTLLFASCAKQVTTNARVNEVVSDKALVKHLQRELARLENELSNAHHSVSVDTTDVLKEKDLKIEELEEHVKELSVQLDRALSQIRDLKQQEQAGERRQTLWEEKDSSYPELCVRPASESSSSDTTILEDQESFSADSSTFEIPLSPKTHSRLSSDGNYSISDFEENLPSTSGSPFEQMSMESPSDASSTLHNQTPKIVGCDHHQVPKRLGARTASLSEVDPSAVSEEICRKSMNCYETDLHQVPESFQYPYFVEFDPYELPRDIGDQTLDSSQVYQHQISRGIAEKILEYDNIDQYLTAEEIRKNDYEQLKEYCKEVQCIDTRTTSNIHEDGGQSLLLRGDHDNAGKCGDDEPIKRSVLSNTTSSSLLNTKEPYDKQQKEDTTRLGDLNCAESTSLQSNHTSSMSSSFFERGRYETKNESENGCDDVQQKDKITTHELLKSIKNMKEVGLNPQDDDLDASSPWPASDFKRVQMEIFDLWDACHVSLVHRTRFFLLFIKDEQADGVYMEVERRRLSFINDAFSYGNSIVQDGQKLKLGSSKISLHKEREMLGRLMKKRFSKQERANLYVKWGIRLDSKRRSSQLAHWLWTDNIDMDHIMESANVVAKLVKLSESQVPKEAFGLNLMSSQRRLGKSYLGPSLLLSP